MKRSFAFFCALVMGISAWAIPLTATWVEGKVEKQKGSSWLALMEGDIVDSADTIRLAKGALVEFTGGKQKLVLSAPGSFVLDSLAKAGQKTTGTVDKLSKLVAPSKGGQDAVGGVRGDLIGAGVDKVSWAGDDEDAATLIANAQALAQDKKYTESADAFGKAALTANGDLRDQASYGQAWSLAALGSSLRAIKILRTMPASGTWSGPRALLLARLDLDSEANDEAVEVLQAAISSGSLAGEDLDLARSMLQEAGVAK